MKKIYAIVTLFALLFTITACKSNKSETMQIFLYHEQTVYNDKMEVFKVANEKVGIELEGYLQRYDSDFRQRFTTGGYKSDLVIYDQDTIESYGFNGTYVDLKPLINEHAPNLKAFFEANPEKEAWATADNGAIYGIPFYTDGKTAKGYFVREDWVNTLRANGKINNIPEDLNTLTVQDFENLLLAFKNNAKLLTGGERIYPFFDQDEDFWISELASLWNGTGEFFLDSENKVKYGPMENEFKTAIENISRWMDLGLIDPNILDGSRSDDRETYFASNIGGATRAWIGSTYSFNDDVYADALVDGFKVTAIAPPTRSDNTKFEPTIRKEIGNVAAIYSQTSEEGQIKLLKWIDYFFSDEGKDLMNYGVEGVTYTKEGNSIKYTNKILNDRKTALANLYSYGAQMQSPGVQTFEYEKAWLGTEAFNAMEMYENNNYLDLNYTKLIYPNVKLSKEEYTTVNAARTSLENIVKVQVYEWVINKTAKNGISSSDWNEFKQKLVQAGAENAINIYQSHVNK